MKKSAETTQAKVEEPQAKPFTKEVQLRRKPGKKETKPIVTPTHSQEVAQPVNIVPPESVVEVITPVVITQEPPAPLTLESLQKAVQLLRQDFDTHTVKLEEILTLVSRKRKPAANGNGRVQIKDNETGAIYKSKNAVYQSMLKAGSLDALVKQGIFGADPAHNTFGVYALFRAYPGRFVEVPPEQTENA